MKAFLVILVLILTGCWFSKDEPANVTIIPNVTSTPMETPTPEPMDVMMYTLPQSPPADPNRISADSSWDGLNDAFAELI